MKNIKRIFFCCIALCFFLPFYVQAEGKEGTVLISLTGTKKDAVFLYKKVGEFQEADRYKNAEQTDQMALSYSKKVKQYDGEVRTDLKGNAKIEGLSSGLYLFLVKEQTEGERIRPFLLTVPMWDEVKKEMSYEVKVCPKHSSYEEERPVAPQTNRNDLGVVLTGVGILLLIVALCMIFCGRKKQEPYLEGKKENEKLIKETVTKEKEEERTIDFSRLKKKNKDIEGWLYVPGTNIDYPVLIGKDNTKYLKQNFEGKQSMLGSVFSFSDAKRDLEDAHLCLFAHNMRSAQMFGELKKYKEESFASTHTKAYLYTPKGRKEFTLFSVYECPKTDQTFEHRMKSGSEEFLKLKDHMRKKNKIQAVSTYNIESRQILTLSCCSDYDRTRNRVAVNFSFTCAKK